MPWTEQQQRLAAAALGWDTTRCCHDDQPIDDVLGVSAAKAPRRRILCVLVGRNMPAGQAVGASWLVLGSARGASRGRHNG